MDLIQELENQFKTKSKTGTIQEKEKIAVEFLNSVDFKDTSNKIQAEQYIKHILTDYVGKNEPITSLEAKIVHCMIAKISLSELNIDNIRVNYLDRTNDHNQAGAFYSDKSINFFNQSVCNKNELLLPYGTDIEKGAKSRLNYFVNEVFKTEHEIQHAVQFEEINKSEKDPEKLSVDDYIISKQYVARLFAAAQGSKYYKKELDVDRLYNENHDQFYYEIDADLQGLRRSLSLLSKLSMQAYNLAIDEKVGWRFLSKLKDKQTQIDNYSDITWEHNTNPDNIKVSANHKASMIIDNILPRLSSKQRAEYMLKYPALLVTYNSNGTKKDLQQIEREFAEKKSKLLINGTDEQIRTTMPNLENLCKTAIESDPVLCFEKCLQHISRMTWDQERYFTDSGMGVKYNPNEIRKELENAKQKALKISKYLEDTQAQTIANILNKYKREILKGQKYDQQSLRFFEDKKLAIYGIESEIYHNKEVKAVIEKDTKEATQKRIRKQMQRAQAEDIIKKIFPNFSPIPHTGTLNNGSIEFSNNVNERMMLMEAYKQYVKSITGTNSKVCANKDFIPSGMLLSAIKELYDFTPTEEEQKQFEEALKNGGIKVVRNKYQPEEVKSSGIYGEEEAKGFVGSTFSYGKQIQNTEISEQAKHPQDPESDAEKARFQSQRQVATERQRQQVEEQKVRPVTQEELDVVKKENMDLDTRRQQEQMHQREPIRQKEDTYVDEYGVVRKREPNDVHADRQRKHNQNFEMTR